MNAPIVKPPQPTALQATAERLLSRGLAGAGWWLADDERLVGAIVDRSMRPAPRWGAASELASQLDGLSLRTKPTSPEPGVSAWPLLQREDRALWLQRRREGPHYQFAVAWGQLPAPAPVKPVRRPAPVRDWAAAAAGEEREERPVVRCAAELRAPPPERPALHPHAEDTSPAGVPVPATAQLLRAVEDQQQAVAFAFDPAGPTVFGWIEPAAAPVEASVLHPPAEDTSAVEIEPEAGAEATGKPALPVEDQAADAVSAATFDPVAFVEAVRTLPAVLLEALVAAEAPVLHPPAEDTSPPPTEPAPAPLLAEPCSAAALCSEEGCASTIYARGRCKMHYQHAWRARHALAAERRRAAASQARGADDGPKLCAEPLCHQPVACKGRCKRCYDRITAAARRHGARVTSLPAGPPLRGQTARGRERAARNAWQALCANPVAGPWQLNNPTTTTQTWERRTIGLVTRPVIALLGRQAGGRWTRWEVMLWPLNEGDPQTLRGFTSRRQAEAVAEAEAHRIGWVLL